jgi:hypothetical protein
MRRFEAEERARKPRDFDAWLLELQLFTDCNGADAVIGVLLHYAPVECLRYLVAQPALWDELLARGRYADQQRYREGVRFGRGVGL